MSAHPPRRQPISWPATALAAAALAALVSGHSQPPRSKPQVLDAMARATRFMVEKVGTGGGYVWSYLPDLSRRWGEMEARPTMIWIQPPGTPTMGHLFLDAYHATGDEYYYRAATSAADALVRGQLPCGGWNYVVDFAGERSLGEWYDTVGRNGWRLEEFQHYWTNATFDDGGTIESAELLLRVYLEKRDPKYRPPLDRAVKLVLDSQYPIGAWPQRYPIANEFSKNGRPDYTSFLTFNDDVTGGNIDFLVLAYETLGDPRLLDAIARGMNAYLALQQKAPQAGWALQYTLDGKPAGARTYEPPALVTHTTASNVSQLLHFYTLTVDSKFLAGVPAALDWLESVRLGPDVLPLAGGRTHPTFVEIGTNKPLYVHRHGSNVVNGAYTVDYDPHNTIAHYNSFREIDVSGLRSAYERIRALPPAAVMHQSALRPQDGARVPPPKYFVAVSRRFADGAIDAASVAAVIARQDADGRWLGELGSTSHPYAGDGPAQPRAGDFSRTYVGDDTDTSPYPVQHLSGISTREYLRNMSRLIRYLDATFPDGKSRSSKREDMR